MRFSVYSFCNSQGLTTICHVNKSGFSLQAEKEEQQKEIVAPAPVKAPVDSEYTAQADTWTEATEPAHRSNWGEEAAAVAAPVVAPVVGASDDWASQTTVSVSKQHFFLLDYYSFASLCRY